MQAGNHPIIKIMDELIELLLQNDEMNWGKALINLRKSCIEYLVINDTNEVGYRVMRFMSGGMGSFNDLVIHKEGRSFIEDNDRLDELSSQLFSAALDLRK